MKLVLGCGLTQGKRIPVAVAGALVVGVVVMHVCCGARDKPTRWDRALSELVASDSMHARNALGPTSVG